MAAFAPTPAMYKKSRQTGTLNLQGYELKEIPDEVVHPFNHLESGEGSHLVVLLTRLNLQDNEIATLPPDMNEIGEELYMLAMRNNKLTALPTCISGCAGLKQVDFSRNEISIIEDFTLPVLADLNLSFNKLKTLPDTFAGMQNLNKLNVAGNSLAELPPSVGHMPSLQVLAVESNRLTSLPNLDGAMKLKTLNCSQNAITSARFPSLQGCRSLSELDASQNKLTAWPALPLEHGNLTKIQVSNNISIGNFPSKLMASVKSSLVELQCAYCNISELPDEIGNVTTLKILNMEFNQLKDIPASLGFLPSLTALKFAGNPIRRKRIDFTSCSEFTAYLRTKASTSGGGPQAAAAAAENGGMAQALKQDQVAKQVAQGVHYGTLSLVNTPPPKSGGGSSSSGGGGGGGRGGARSPRAAASSRGSGGSSGSGASGLGGESLGCVPAAVFEAEAKAKLTKLTVQHHAVPLVKEGAFTGFDLLTLLDLSHNLIGSVRGSTNFLRDVAALPRLETLNLRDNKISNSGLAVLAASGDDASFLFPNLTELDVSCNSLTEFPYATLLKHCRKLSSFNLGHNGVGAIGDEHPLLSASKSLTALNLGHNKLNDLGQFRFLESLVHFNIEGNELKAIPPELSVLPNLKTLTAGGNPQRTVPLGTVEAGANQLLPFLRRRLGVSYQVPQWVVDAREAAPPSPPPPQATPVAAAAAAPAKGRAGSAAAAAAAGGASSGSSSGGAASDGGEGEDAATESLVRALRAEVEELDRQLEDGSLSAASKHAIKKKRQMKNAERIRAERKK